MTTIKHSQIELPIGDDVLCMQRFCSDKPGDVVFMLHGSIENGKIFYTHSGKGLAPFLARHGYDVFVADLRGRGASRPKINRHSLTGQSEWISSDVPAFINKIIELRGNTPQHWIAHSWGGVVLSAVLARNEPYRRMVRNQVYFGSKRRVLMNSVSKFFMLSIMWDMLGRILVLFYGYLPAKQWRLGSDNETKKSYQQTSTWIKANSWQEPEDGFDYKEAYKTISLPPTLFIAGQNDNVLGNAIDVKAFMHELNSDKHYLLLSKSTGFMHDYDHINMLTHRDASHDHFIKVLAFLADAGKA